MCGIAGFVDFSRTSSPEDLVSMTDALEHRGPDGSGYDCFGEDVCRIGLGHRRLAIIDLTSGGAQPMWAADRNTGIVFNGEIYNFKEIRTELMSLGRKFVSESDTEVVLQAYGQWGLECAERLNGMFALVIYDERRRRLVLLRDRAGEKPLFYSWDGHRLLFGSELKALMAHPGFERELDNGSLAQFLRFGYVNSPYSIFKSVRKLPPASCLVFELDKKEFRVFSYWDVEDHYMRPPLDVSPEEARREVERRLEQACVSRMVADVPVGVFLSGGYDSTVVTALLSRHISNLRTFTIGFDESRYDEAEHARKVAAYFGTEHVELRCTERDALELVSRLPEIYDEPFGDNSAISTLLLCSLTCKHVKVALSGDGGDELFAGYNQYAALDRLRKKGRLVPQSVRALIGKALGCERMVQGGSGSDRMNFLMKRIGAFAAPSAGTALKVNNSSLGPADPAAMILGGCTEKDSPYDTATARNDLDTFLAVHFKTFLGEDVLQKVDRASMAVSMEAREPLLDHRLVEYVVRLPLSVKAPEGKRKALLKDIAWSLAPRHLTDRAKQGFGVPAGRWLKGELFILVSDYLDDARVRREGIFDPDLVKSALERFLSGDVRNPRLVWNLLMFQMWKEKWLA